MLARGGSACCLRAVRLGCPASLRSF